MSLTRLTHRSRPRRPLPRGASLQERIEHHPVGRTLIVAFLGFHVLAITLTSLPDSALRDATRMPTRPYVEFLGLNQEWGVFGNPRRQTVELRAEIEYDDGTMAVWTSPGGGPFVGTYRFYRWDKWMSLVRLDTNDEWWPATARWVARQHGREGAKVERVTLVRRWYDTARPGTDPDDHGAWQHAEFHTEQFDVGGGG